ncbi:hypothetical protein DFJ43DRAFT_1059259 [Lentinula guzmanii]|uniref:Uncharacterized protein n=1 Tax=Lentinula guzmanii TaxID=2804957 RepID=A0AA38JNB0_9AGAR|nr:hypothetical protein DFJ43DRAFT_1059259 [Lentinula guzmanii]
MDSFFSLASFSFSKLQKWNKPSVHPLVNCISLLKGSMLLFSASRLVCLARTLTNLLVIQALAFQLLVPKISSIYYRYRKPEAPNDVNCPIDSGMHVMTRLEGLRMRAEKVGEITALIRRRKYTIMYKYIYAREIESGARNKTISGDYEYRDK